MEFLDVVDENDRVVGVAPIKEVYDRSLTHRIVHVIAFNSKHDIALQLRSASVNFCPLHWCTTAGGHVRSGETYEEAARRELKEEAGVDLPLKFAYKDVFVRGSGMKKILATFTADFGGPFFVNEEAERIEFFSASRIEEMIREKGKFHPELLFLLEKHLGILKNI